MPQPQSFTNEFLPGPMTNPKYPEMKRFSGCRTDVTTKFSHQSFSDSRSTGKACDSGLTFKNASSDLPSARGLCMKITGLPFAYRSVCMPDVGPLK